MPSSSQVCYKQPGPPPLTASCYICLEHSTIDQPLLRNCACRGDDAGWAHVACLAKFAASKVTELEAQGEQDPSINISSFWENCILCKTPYMQYMGVAMAEAFVKQYEHLPDTNELRLSSIYSLARGRYHVGNYDGAFELLVRLEQLCDVLTSKGSDIRKQEGCVLAMMGAVFFEKQQFHDALPLFERLRELWVILYGPNSKEVQENNKMIVTLKENIGIRGRLHQKRDMAAELVRARERFRENQECVDIRHRLFIHSKLVHALRNNGRHQEAMEQSKKLVFESKQNLGPNHPDTLSFENDAAKYRQGIASQKKDVWAMIDCVQQPAISGQRVQVLRATKDARKYICLIKNHNGVSSKFKVTQNQFILEAGTAVVVHGVVSSTDSNVRIGIIDSFDKEKRLYAVSLVGKKKTSVSIKPINLDVFFVEF